MLIQSQKVFDLCEMLESDYVFVLYRRSLYIREDAKARHNIIKPHCILSLFGKCVISIYVQSMTPAFYNFRILLVKVFRMYRVKLKICDMIV